MATRRKPTVTTVSPSNYSTKVSVTTSIKITFDIDLDGRYIDDFIYLLDGLGERVDGRIVYRKKVITFTPKEPLSMGTTYKLCIIGDSDLTDDQEAGIRSILGDSMEGNVFIQFTTESDETTVPPVMISPLSQSVIREHPVFEWEPVDGMKGYQLQISTSNQFTTLIYPSADEEVELIQDVSIEPSIELEEGNYYFRIRSVREDGVTSQWSRTFQFHYTTSENGKIAEGDEDPFDTTDDELFGVSMELELVDEFPKDHAIDIPLNVKTIFFRVIGDIDLELIDSESFTITGKHISDDWEEESHGELQGKFMITKSKDGTAYLLFLLDPIQLDTEEDKDSDDSDEEENDDFEEDEPNNEDGDE